MHRLLSNLMNRLPKPIYFGIGGALGGLFGALLGEVFLLVSQPVIPSQTTPSPPQSVCILIDCSSSMRQLPGFSTSKLDEVKKAAIGFIHRQDLTRHRLAIIGFGSLVRVGTPLTQNSDALENAIGQMYYDGLTEMGKALQEAMQQLDSAPGARSILLFTDGQPQVQGISDQEAEAQALQVAQSLRNQGIRIVAVGTGDANMNFLASLTGDTNLVFPTSQGSFGESFQEAGKKIFGASMVEKAANSGHRAMLRVSGWTGLIGLAIALMLIASQNTYMHRKTLRLREGISGGLGAFVAGIVAGIAGEAFFAMIRDVAVIGLFGRLFAWSLLGALLGGGMAFVIPNLKMKRAMIGGGIGGAIGVLAFLMGGLFFGDALGRLAGAAILGFFIGLMIALVEAFFREAWLEINWGPKEQSVINLGVTPILLGSSSECQVHLNGFPSVAAAISLHKGQIMYEDRTTGNKMALNNNSKLQIGSINIMVKASR